jgi:hypothetical protein
MIAVRAARASVALFPSVIEGEFALLTFRALMLFWHIDCLSGRAFDAAVANFGCWLGVAACKTVFAPDRALYRLIFAVGALVAVVGILRRALAVGASKTIGACTTIFVRPRALEAFLALGSAVFTVCTSATGVAMIVGLDVVLASLARSALASTFGGNVTSRAEFAFESLLLGGVLALRAKVARHVTYVVLESSDFAYVAAALASDGTFQALVALRAVATLHA